MKHRQRLFNLCKLLLDFTRKLRKIDDPVFSALAQHNIPVQMVATSEIKLSVVIDENHLETAVRVLHDAFGLDQEPDGCELDE